MSLPKPIDKTIFKSINKKDCILWAGRGSNSTERTQFHGTIRRYDKHRGRVITKTIARYYYEKANGPLRKGVQVYHRCGVTLCINLDHLIAGTRSALYKLMSKEGVRDFGSPPRSHCAKGHPLEGDNLYLWENKEGRKRRLCKECRNKLTRDRLRKRFGWKPRKDIDKTNHPDMSDPKKYCGKKLHTFTKDNTHVYWNVTEKRWIRLCRTCMNKRLRLKWRREKGKGGMISKYRSEWDESYGESDE